MKKTLKTSLCIYQDIVDLMIMMYKLKGAEMVNNKEIAEKIQEAINKVDIARNNIYESNQILQQIHNETYDS